MSSRNRYLIQLRNSFKVNRVLKNESVRDCSFTKYSRVSNRVSRRPEVFFFFRRHWRRGRKLMMSENFRDFFFFHQIGKLCTSTNQEEQLVLRGVPKREDVLKEWKELNSCLSLSFIAKILKKMRFYLEKRKGNLFISWKTKSKDFISSSPSKENCGNFFCQDGGKTGTEEVINVLHLLEYLVIT